MTHSTSSGRAPLTIVIYAGGMPFNGETIPAGRSLGGSESAAYYLARELARRGHRLTVFSEIPPEAQGHWDGVRYLALGERTERTPLGAQFEFYARGTPHDVLIGQRHPLLFARPLAAKLCLWWTHDLALARHAAPVHAQGWQVDAVLAVSEWHKAQVGEVYGIPAAHIRVVPNGVDPALFAQRAEPEARFAGKTLVYASRPERGLAYLVGPGGVMEHLRKADPAIVLKVAGYDHTTPEMAPLYDALWRRCDLLPNVERLGALGKRELAALFGGAALWVYPTDFEEVSCITAMEAMAAGLPAVCSGGVGALPETLEGAGVRWVVAGGDLATRTEAFAHRVHKVLRQPDEWRRLHAAQLAAAPRWSWAASADRVEALIAELFAARTADPERLARHLLHHSDVYAARAVVAAHNGAIPEQVRADLAEYNWADDPAAYRAHYERGAAWEAAHGNHHGLGTDRPLAMPRVQAVLDLLDALPPGARVLDFGCAVGHVTTALARRYPHLEFEGWDLSAGAIAEGNAWLEKNPLANVTLRVTPPHPVLPREGGGGFALVLVCEVLEHVPEPGILADRLEALSTPGGLMCVTVPYGPWEAESWARWGFRQHLHHLERDDLLELWGGKRDYGLLAVPVQASAQGEPLGCYRVVWRAAVDNPPSGTIDLARKLGRQAPAETLSVCMICRAGSETLGKCLSAVAPLAAQIAIGMDGGEGPALEAARRYSAEVFPIESPLVQGFDAARNATLERARGDWILWIDDDEVLQWPERLPKYLRPNGYDAYAIRQRHLSGEPAGLLKTDLPCRLFRNRRGFRFFGVVHEHPEIEAVNRGSGQVYLLPDVEILHHGYETEDVRRRRFERNFALLVRDREKYPERHLAKYLYIRDLAHLNRYALEAGAPRDAAVLGRAREGVALWRALLAGGQTRMAVDALIYYSELVHVLGETWFDMAIDLTWQHPLGFGGRTAMTSHEAAGGAHEVTRPVQARFANEADARLLLAALVDEQLKPLKGKYL